MLTNVQPLEQVEHIISQFKDEKFDAIYGVTDEPSIIVSLLAKRWGLHSTSERSICLAQNKGLFAQICSKINRSYPDTQIITEVGQEESWDVFPAFIKPAKGSLSMYSYKVSSKEELRTLVTRLLSEKRELLDWSTPFYDAFAQPSDPPAYAFLLQPYMDYPQFTLDGYVDDGETHFLGITATIYTAGRESFDRFDYPAHLSKDIMLELQTLISNLVEKLEYDNAPFNIEFFVDEHDEIILIEFNTRLSLQFVPLMKQAYKPSNLEVAFQLSAGEHPLIELLPEPRMATSYVWRSFSDQYVESVPAQSEIDSLKGEDVLVSARILVKPGSRLSDYEQDSYTYRYALLDVAGKSLEEILGKIEVAKKRLQFVFS